MASWTTPPTFAAGETVPESKLDDLGTNQDFLFAPPRVEVKRTADQSLTDGVVDEIDWQAEEYDDDDSRQMWESGANSGHIVCQTAGVYEVWWYLEIDPNSTGVRLMTVSKNDAAFTGQGPTGGTASLATRFAGAIMIELVATDFITFGAYQATGGALPLDFTRTRAGMHFQSGPTT